MRKLQLTIFLVLAVFALSCKEKQETTENYTAKIQTAESTPTKEERIKRGEYLAKAIGCDHCHSPKKMTEAGPVPDMERWMMGYPANDPLPEIKMEALGPGKWGLFNGDLTAFVGPWGVTFGANLTPDDTGIGTWTFDQFKKAMTEGKHKGMDNTRPLLPPMPWQTYAGLTEEDLQSIYDYLMSLKPIENVVPAYIPPDRIQ